MRRTTNHKITHARARTDAHARTHADAIVKGMQSAGKLAKICTEGEKVMKERTASAKKGLAALLRSLKDMQKKMEKASQTGFTRQSASTLTALADSIEKQLTAYENDIRLAQNAGTKAVKLAQREGYEKGVNETSRENVDERLRKVARDCHSLNRKFQDLIKKIPARGESRLSKVKKANSNVLKLFKKTAEYIKSGNFQSQNANELEQEFRSLSKQYQQFIDDFKKNPVNEEQAKQNYEARQAKREENKTKREVEAQKRIENAKPAFTKACIDFLNVIETIEKSKDPQKGKEKFYKAKEKFNKKRERLPITWDEFETIGKYTGLWAAESRYMKSLGL